MAEDTLFSRRTVMRSVQNLARIGLITISSDPARRSNTNTFNMDRLSEAANLEPAPLRKKAKSKKPNGKTYHRVKLDLYPSNLICNICSKVPSDCGCEFSCEKKGCAVKSLSLAGYFYHAYSVHRLKLRELDNGSLELRPIPTAQPSVAQNPKPAAKHEPVCDVCGHELSKCDCYDDMVAESDLGEMHTSIVSDGGGCR
jgi:hypothetical protein